MKRIITIEVNDEYLADLKRQKRLLLVLQGSSLIPQSVKDEIDGMLGCYDEIQDKAVIERFNKNEVFDFSRNHPQGEIGHNRDYNKEVADLESEIITLYKINRY